MIPKGLQGIEHLTTRIMADLVPKMQDAYTGADLMLMAEMLNLISQDYDRAVDVLVADHAAVIPILKSAEPHLDDADLRSRIAHALAAETQSLRVHEISKRGDIVLRALIDLHAAVEQAMDEGAAWAEDINYDIWRFLDAYVARRAYQSAM